MTWFGFSSRKCQYLLSQLPVSFIRKEVINLSGRFLSVLLFWLKILLSELIEVTLLWYPDLCGLSKFSYSFLFVALMFSASALPFVFKWCLLPQRCWVKIFLFLTMLMWVFPNRLNKWMFVRVAFTLSVRKEGWDVVILTATVYNFLRIHVVCSICSHMNNAKIRLCFRDQLNIIFHIFNRGASEIS